VSCSAIAVIALQATTLPSLRPWFVRRPSDSHWTIRSSPAVLRPAILRRAVLRPAVLRPAVLSLCAPQSCGPAPCGLVVLLSCALLSYILLSYCPVILRIVLPSCLFIQHLFDFRPTFVRCSLDVRLTSVRARIRQVRRSLEEQD
jgi:hypothetical protein